MTRYDKTLLIAVCVVVALLFFAGANTFGLLENGTKASSELNVAKWDILLDGNHMSEETLKLTNFNFVNDSHVEEGYIAPGSKGSVLLEIDPNDADVAIKYTISYSDRNQDPDCILVLNNIVVNGTTVVRTGEYEYTGILTLEEIKNKVKPVVEINVEWPQNDENDKTDYKFGLHTEESLFIDLNLVATQYLGETLVPYSGA